MITAPPVTVRDTLVRELTRALIGPADGQYEVLPLHRHPREEYLCGILAPQQATTEEADALLAADPQDPEAAEEDDADPATPLPPDARQIPSSFGLSFVAESTGPLQLQIAATYARYYRTEAGWERSPHGWASGEVTLENDTSWSPDPSTAVVVRRQQIEGTGWLVSIFFLNRAQHDSASMPPVEALIFQPELRIRLGSGVRLADLRTLSMAPEAAAEDEEQSLNLLYRDQPILARGHMCSVVWHGVDPEAAAPGGQALLQPTDIDLVPELFRNADLRTVFMPLYNVSSPLTDWPDDIGSAPELRPDVLAETFAPDALRQALQPLVDGYSAWVASLDAQEPIAHAHVESCLRVCNRLRDAIEFLIESVQGRLAFCFAQKAMATQWAWRGRQQSSWRPFQLAFMLLCLRSVAEPSHPDRSVCDLLWFPTGGGKTEAYLGVAAFTLAWRRLHGHDGLAVISRYTLRLLTIQQFRRTLRMITACEMLRVLEWLPNACPTPSPWSWGTTRFSAGLWVGGHVTPNHLHDTGFPDPVYGACTLLRGDHAGHGEPAQVLECPACAAVLAISQPRNGRQDRPALAEGQELTLHLVFYRTEGHSLPSPDESTDLRLRVLSLECTALENAPWSILSVRLQAGEGGVSAFEVDQWWEQTMRPRLGNFSGLACARASRPGYFLHPWKDKKSYVAIEVFCPAPDCPLSIRWKERTPQGWLEVLPPFRTPLDPTTGCRVPIPAVMVDEQLYGHPPSVLVATVDKFARLAFEPAAASLFGNVDRYHPRHGFYRHGDPPGAVKPGQPDPSLANLSVVVPPFRPPDLVLQDELHLLDGPLGSMVGLYETVIDTLCENPKYIASTATVRQAGEQIGALFCRRLQQFPPPGLTAADNFFARTPPAHPLESARPGRLYLGVCAPGRGALQALLRIWSTVLALTEKMAGQVPWEELDPFWTVVGYFNAIRELAELNSLYRQEIPQRAALLLDQPRRWPEALELSSRMDPLQLPALLNRLEVPAPAAERVALATSMFGTGVDVVRLGLMIVHGQPKTTSSYIQATGRVGRQRGGLVVTFFQAARPRDLVHYEFFTAYHSRLYQAVEPVSVAPFSPRARERALGPMCVALLRQARALGGYPVTGWLVEQRDKSRSVSGSRLMHARRTEPEVLSLATLFETRASLQPWARRPEPGQTTEEVSRELDLWSSVSGAHGSLLYCEYAVATPPSHAVVLGDAQHQHRSLPAVFPSAPQSLRDVEAPIGFHVMGRAQQIRPSQFITTYGPGSILEGPDGPRLVYGLELCGAFGEDPIRTYAIPEPTLARIMGGPVVRIPSNAERNVVDTQPIYSTLGFPTWSLCVEHHVLYRYSFNSKRTGCPDCIPLAHPAEATVRARREAIRFVLACRQGHLDDVNWPDAFEHRRPECRPEWLQWHRSGAAMEHVRLECPLCQAGSSLATVYYREWRCSGRFPERKVNEPCTETARVINRAAANLHLSSLISAITIPRLDTTLHQTLASSQVLPILKTLRSLSMPIGQIREHLMRLCLDQTLPAALSAELVQYDDTVLERTVIDVLAAPDVVSSESEVRHNEHHELHRAALLGHPRQRRPGDPPSQLQIVRDNVCLIDAPGGHRMRVAPVSRLRVVTALRGYRRLSSDGHLVDASWTTSGERWYPGIELLGEGIFLEMAGDGDDEPLPHFELAGSEARSWHHAWHERQDDALHPVHIWWHTLAHRLLNTLAVDSGYGSASMRERIFFNPAPATGAILLYTVQPGGDGTLGGLIALVPRFERILRASLANIRTCSNDPLCREAPRGAVNGAACHACGMVSETACERHNQYLDRRILMENLP